MIGCDTKSKGYWWKTSGGNTVNVLIKQVLRQTVVYKVLNDAWCTVTAARSHLVRDTGDKYGKLTKIYGWNTSDLNILDGGEGAKWSFVIQKTKVTSDSVLVTNVTQINQV